MALRDLWDLAKFAWQLSAALAAPFGSSYPDTRSIWMLTPRLDHEPMARRLIAEAGKQYAAVRGQILANVYRHTGGRRLPEGQHAQYWQNEVSDASPNQSLPDVSPASKKHRGHAGC